MHLILIKGLSYDGVVCASAAHPDVFVDDPEKYTALLESGYFEALPDAHTVTGHLDADFLGEMDEEQLDKLADDMGVDTTGKDKAEVVAAVAEEPVEVPDISKMKLDELKEFAEDNGIDLTGCTTKASICRRFVSMRRMQPQRPPSSPRRADGRTAVGHAGGTQRVHRI